MRASVRQHTLDTIDPQVSLQGTWCAAVVGKRKHALSHGWECNTHNTDCFATIILRVMSPPVVGNEPVLYKTVPLLSVIFTPQNRRHRPLTHRPLAHRPLTRRPPHTGLLHSFPSISKKRHHRPWPYQIWLPPDSLGQ